jgi:hypothetical protein
MRNCPDERKIDRYLLGRMSEDETREFEIHYFSCPSCFERMRDREAVVESVARKRADLLSPPAERPAFGFRPRLWATAAAAAAFLLVIAAALVLRPWERGVPAPGEGVVRGAALAAVAPAGDLPAAPEMLAWNPGPPDLEYRVELDGPGLSWSAPAPGPSIVLPPDVRAKLARGAVYTWQVKGYAAEGTLLARSPKTTFRVR